MNRPFPEVVSHSLLSSWATCQRQVELSTIEGWARDQLLVTHASVGAAFAAGCEAMRNSFFLHGEDAETALCRGVQQLLTTYGPNDWYDNDGNPHKKCAQRAAEALVYYGTEAFPLEQEAWLPVEHGLESTGYIELPIAHPTTGQPIRYAVTLDQVVRHRDTGVIAVQDDKTASALGQPWRLNYRHSGQFRGYVYVCRQLGLDVRDVLIRGVAFLTNDFKHEELFYTLHDAELAVWYNSMLLRVARMKDAWETGLFEYSFSGESCGKFGGCVFLNYCADPHYADYLASQGFSPGHRWNPLTREVVHE